MHGEATQHTRMNDARWQKYERDMNRVVTSPAVIVKKATLREGKDILYKQLMSFDVDFFLAREISDLEMGIHIFDSDRRWAFGINSTLLGQLHQAKPSGSYRVSYHLVADLPAGKYTAGFAFAEKLPEGQQELAWYDVLCEFQVHHQSSQPFAGYAYLPAQISLSPTRLAVPECVVTQAKGVLQVLTSLSTMMAGTQTKMGVEIINHSEQAWLGDIFRPINLSYHWLKSTGEGLIFDGLRTPLQKGGIGPGEKLVSEVLVNAPSDAGTYALVLTLVQEGVCWFETVGFEPARLKIEVRNAVESNKK